MKRLYLIIYIMVAIGCCFASCGSNDVTAGSAAVAYYEALIDSDYVAFADGMAGKKDMPKEYHDQFVLLSKAFAEKQNAEHNGLCGVKLKRYNLNKEEDLANVFLELCYSDSTREEVLVPMVLEDDVWLMK
ncbi:MAG: hypothetical protein MJZ08_09465 [Bacteroidaceae bacterium]|nr:hypothetical protein [Bacteroidaceae bacterium]